MNKLVKVNTFLKYLNMILIGLNASVLFMAITTHDRSMLLWGLLGISCAIFALCSCINTEQLIKKHLE